MLGFRSRDACQYTVQHFRCCSSPSLPNPLLTPAAATQPRLPAITPRWHGCVQAVATGQYFYLAFRFVMEGPCQRDGRELPAAPQIESNVEPVASLSQPASQPPQHHSVTAYSPSSCHQNVSVAGPASDMLPACSLTRCSEGHPQRPPARSAAFARVRDCLLLWQWGLHQHLSERDDPHARAGVHASSYSHAITRTSGEGCRSCCRSANAASAPGSLLTCVLRCF
jgi:hypothetical protein